MALPISPAELEVLGVLLPRPVYQQQTMENSLDSRGYLLLDGAGI